MRISDWSSDVCSSDLAVIAVHSTVTQAALLRWARDAQTRGLHLIDAPITGGASGAESAALCAMVGGETSIIERLRPVFDCWANKIIHAGDRKSTRLNSSH